MTLMVILTVAGFIFLYLKLPKDWRERIVGMDHVSDIVFSLGVVILLGTMTATFIGMMVGIAAGVAISVILYIRKRVGTHQVLEREGMKLKWKRMTPKWRARFNGFAEGWHASKNTE